MMPRLPALQMPSVKEYQRKIVTVAQRTTYARRTLRRTLKPFLACIKKEKQQVCLRVTVTIQHKIHGVSIYNIYNENVFILVFPSEFQQNDGGITCKNINNHTIKKFDFPNDFLSDNTEALEICQKYCLSYPTCWGCSLICHDESSICYSGMWNAISVCNVQKRLGVDERIRTSQKPSKNSISCMSFFFMPTYF